MESSLIIGGVLVFVGVLINRLNLFFLVAGYNTLSKKKRDKFDIKPFVQFQEKVFVATGVIIILLSLIMKYFNKEHFMSDVATILIVIAVAVLLFASRKFVVSEYVSKKNYIVAIITVVFLFGIFYTGMKEPSFITKENALVSNSIYSLDIKYKNIKDVKISDKLPTITVRTNGFSFMGYSKGYFKTKEYGSVKLLINRDIPVYIYITTNDNSVYVINTEDKEETNSLYKSISERIE